MKEQSMIEVTHGALFNVVNKNLPHFTIYLMSLVKGEEIRGMTCSIFAEIYSGSRVLSLHQF